MRLLLKALPILTALALAVSASAQPLPPDDPESNYVRELVIMAPSAGPAMWKVSKGSTVVWVLALPPSNVPDSLNWDRSTLRRRLRGARVLLLPPQGQSNFIGGWSEAFPDTVSDEVVEAARGIGVPPGRYLPATLPSTAGCRMSARRFSA